MTIEEIKNECENLISSVIEIKTPTEIETVGMQCAKALLLAIYELKQNHYPDWVCNSCRGKSAALADIEEEFSK